VPTSDLASGVTTICKYAFDRETVQRGLDYTPRDGFLSSNALLHKDNLHIHATVRGRQPQPYLVEARLIRRQGGMNIEAICTCPVGFNCKHVVAAIADIFGKEGMKLFAARADRVTLEEPETVVEAPPEPLPDHHAGWLRSLRAAPAQSMPSKTPLKTIVYRLDISSYRGLEVHILQSSPLKSGALGKASPWRSQQTRRRLPLSAGGSDHTPRAGGHGLQIRVLHPARRLRHADASAPHRHRQYCHWKTVRHDAPLKPGLVRSATLDWATASDGTQTPTMALQPPADTISHSIRRSISIRPPENAGA